MVQVVFLYNCNAAEVAVDAYGPCVARVLTYGRTSTDKGQLMTPYIGSVSHHLLKVAHQDIANTLTQHPSDY